MVYWERSYDSSIAMQSEKMSVAIDPHSTVLSGKISLFSFDINLEKSWKYYKLKGRTFI